MKNSSTLKSALVVVGGGLAVSPASGLELGDVKVQSSLGQPLRASIAYALAPNEALNGTCVTIQRNRDSSGVPALNSASVIVADGVIAITGNSVVREPMMTMRVNIRCPYTAQLTREYMMFIDPAGTAAAPIEAPVASRPQIATPQAAPAPVTPRPRTVNRDRIGDVSRYQVQPGESLSEIVQRMDTRINGFWGTVNAVFATNPDAFVDNDQNKLKAGSWLTLPGSAADAVVTTATTAATDVGVDEVASTGSAYEPESVVAPLDEPATDEVVDPMADLQPGEVILDSNNPFLAPIESTADDSVVIPDTLLEGPETTSESPNVPVATIQRTTAAEAGNTNWLLWLVGGGLAIIVGMLLFGRRFRDKFGSTPIGSVVPQRRAADGDAQNVEAFGEVDMDIIDTPRAAENLALDVDLGIGTGLQESADVDVAQDFGFAETTDLELPEEMSSSVASSETDIIPALHVDDSSILDSEVLPEEDDDYDMSVIVDATKMPHPDDVAEWDLQAIQVDTDDDKLGTDEYTVDQEVDFKILEQDYEDELTATQALNAEIQKAAEDLAVRLEDEAGDEISKMPLATVHELDVTAQMPGRSKQEIGDDDDTGVNPAFNLEAEGETVEMSEEKTVEMPKGGSKAG